MHIVELFLAIHVLYTLTFVESKIAVHRNDKKINSNNTTRRIIKRSVTMNSEKAKVKIGIIGAGLAGLRAARHFEQVGIDYTILEGSGRVGGRVFPFSYGRGYLQYGAEYVNGVDNEIYQIVKKYNLLYDTDSRTSDLWMLDEGAITIVDGKPVDKKILKVWNKFIKSVDDKLYDQCLKESEWKKTVADKVDEYFQQFLNANNFDASTRSIYQNLCKIFKNYFQTEWSSPSNELGLRNLCTFDDGTDEDDSAVLNEFGFKRILDEFTARIPKEKIRLNSKVINLDYNTDNVALRLESGEILDFDSVIVTTSLGYLKRHKNQMFSPPLPSEKNDAIQRMGFGSNMKVFLEYDKVWWPQDTPTIMISSSSLYNSSQIEANLMVFQPNNWATNVLVAWVAGSGPAQIATKTDEQVRNLIDTYLKKNLNGQFNVGTIKKIYRHDWIVDEFALGSYSYLTPQSQDDISVLGEPLLKDYKPFICFAGEHTDPDMYQTTVGAARSGLREAVRIALYYS